MSKKRITVSDVVRDKGRQVTVPESISLSDAIALLERRRDYEETEVTVDRTFDVFPWDGALAARRVLDDVFGFTQQVGNMFSPPQLIDVKVDAQGNTVRVPWGQIELPSRNKQCLGQLFLRVGHTDGRVSFRLTCMTLRKFEDVIVELFDRIRDELRERSIYKGKALALRFYDDDGDALDVPEPEFMDTDVNPADLIFPQATRVAVETNLFTPLTRLDDLKRNQIPVKRGILLGGPYGTGKTMTAKVASKYATENGITFLYCRRTSELAHVIKFARQYADPAVVIFCEDIDAVVRGERNVAINDILNTLDGVDTKNLNLIALLTTNHMEDIAAAMLRPGRLDAVIEVPAPDADAVVKLLHVYGRGVIDLTEDLSEVGEELEGAIPAVVAEVVKRAKLHELALRKPGEKIERLSAQALLNAAMTMRAQRSILALRAERDVEERAALERKRLGIPATV